MFSDQVAFDIRQHALEEYPRECCGVVLAEGYARQVNLAQESGHFRMDSDALRGLDVLAYVHSHCDAPAAPSAYDMRQQIATAKPWGLVTTDGVKVTKPLWWGDEVPIAPLLGRMFVHGIWDCYSLIRDYYRQEMKIPLIEVPRDDGWWKMGQDLYRQIFPEAGFVKIDSQKLEPGDVFLTQIAGSPVMNHGGVLVENSVIMHHVSGGLSTRRVGGQWIWKPSTLWLRHKSKM